MRYPSPLARGHIHRDKIPVACATTSWVSFAMYGSCIGLLIMEVVTQGCPRAAVSRCHYWAMSFIFHHLRPDQALERLLQLATFKICSCLKLGSLNYQTNTNALAISRGRTRLKISTGSLLSGPAPHLADLQFRAGSLLPMAIHEQAPKYQKFQNMLEILKCQNPVCSIAELSSC